jgi:penicillin-binding protein 1A
VVLDQMEQHDPSFITHAQNEKARAEEIIPREHAVINPLNSWAIDAVLHELEAVIPLDRIDTGGLKIDTTIDAGLQRAAEKAVAGRLQQIEQRSDFRQQHHVGKGGEPAEMLQGALIAMDNASGGITAIVGGRDFAKSKYNRALVAMRQIGSSAKPFVYEEAIREGVITPETPLSDARLTPSDLPPRFTSYDPQNSDGTFQGEMPAKEGLIHSRNTMSVRVGMKAGLGDIASTMERLGLAEHVPHYPSICLGSFESTLRNLTTAYTALATGGKKLQPHLIEQVTDSDGTVLYRATHGRIPVLNPEATRITTSMLTEVMTRGTAAKSSEMGLNKPAAGKTGTTDHFVDAWFLGYTQGLTCGVWVGFDRPKTIMHGGYGAELALPIWVDVMKSPAADHFARGPLL